MRKFERRGVATLVVLHTLSVWFAGWFGCVALGHCKEAKNNYEFKIPERNRPTPVILPREKPPL